MVAWEQQLQASSVPAWRDKYVAYARLKRKLEEIKTQSLVDDFLADVYKELHRVASWYEEKVASLELRVQFLKKERIHACDSAEHATWSGMVSQINSLYLEAVQLTEFVLLSAEALRKIVKKMDKQFGTSHQKDFIKNHLMKS